MRVEWPYLVLASGVLLFMLLGSVLSGRLRQSGATNQQSKNESMIGVTHPNLLSDRILAVDGTKNQILMSLLNGSEQQRIASPVGTVIDLLPSPTGQQVLVTGTQTSGWTMVTLESSQATPLHPGVFSPAWSPKGDRIAYIFADDSLTNLRLTIAKPDGTDWQTIFYLSGVENPFERLWWSPLESYLIGLDTAATPPRYVRILLSSKRIETLARGNGELRWSPSGKLALLDGPEPNRVQVANVESGQVTPLELTTNVDWLVWESEETLIGIIVDQTGPPKLGRIDLGTKQVQLLESDVTPNTVAQILGIHDQLLYVYRAGTVSSVSIKK